MLRAADPQSAGRSCDLCEFLCALCVKCSFSVTERPVRVSHRAHAGSQRSLCLTVLTTELAETDSSSGRFWRHFKKLALKYSRRIVWQKLPSTITVRSESRANSPFAIRLGAPLTCQAGRPLAFAAVGIRKTSPSATAPTAKPGFNQKYKHGLCRPPLPSPRNKAGLNATQPTATEQQANGYRGAGFVPAPTRAPLGRFGADSNSPLIPSRRGMWNYSRRGAPAGNTLPGICRSVGGKREALADWRLCSTLSIALKSSTRFMGFVM
jgi:hypothetical protein